MVAQGVKPAGREKPAQGSRRTSVAGRAVGALTSGIVLVSLLAGCSMRETFSMGYPRGGVSTQSQQLYDFWIGSVIAALVVGVFVWGLIFWCVIRYRKRGEELPAQTRYNLPIELIYTVIPFLIVSVLFYYTAIIQTNVTKIDGNPDVTVQVEAFKWNWKFTYPQAKGTDGQPVFTVGSSEVVPILVVPTNKKILIEEHSTDVIHSFWVPQLLFKRDVFPGNVVNKFEVTIVEEGHYVGRCAELCGAYHSMMNFELRAVSPDEYATFLAAKQSGQSTEQALTAIGESATATTTVPFTEKPNPSS